MKDEIKKHVEKEISSIEYGKVIVEIRGNKVDVITEKRKRFEEKEFKKG